VRHRPLCSYRCSRAAALFRDQCQRCDDAVLINRSIISLIDLPVLSVIDYDRLIVAALVLF